MTIFDKILYPSAGFLLLAATAVAAWFAQPLWLLAPLAVICLAWLLKHPVLLFYLLLFSIPWSVEYTFPSGTGTDLPDEPLMLLTCFTTLALFITHHKTAFRGGRLHPFAFILLVQLFWIALTVVLSTYFVLSAKYLLAKTWYLLAFVATPLFLWKDELVFKRSVFVLFTSMLMVTGVSLLRHAITGFTFSTINAAVAPFFRNHVNYSALLVCMVPLQILCWQQAKTRQRKQMVFLSFLITLPALYFAFARGAWLALLTAAFAYWLLNRRWLFQSFIAMVMLVTALVFWLRHDNRYLHYAHDYTSTIFHPNLNEHLAATYQLKDMSTAERFHRWIAGVRMLEGKWQTGFGPTTFYRHYKSYTVPAFKTWVSKNEEQSTVHNYFLLLAVEQGIVGLLLFLTLLGMQFLYVQKIYHRTTDLFWKRTVMAIGAILVMLCTLNFLSDLIETDKAGSIFYLCLAALIVADKKTKSEKTPLLPA